MYLFQIIVVVALVSVVQSFKILIVFPVPAHSHYKLGNALGIGLAKAGHDVTMLSPYEDKNAPKNYKNVVLTGLEEEKQKVFNPFDMENMHPWIISIFMNSIGNQLTEAVLEHQNFKKILNDHFEVIIVEQFKDDALKVLQCHFQAPLIMFSTIGPNVWVNLDVANPSPPSYVPDIFLSYSSAMNIWQRTHNSLTLLVQTLNYYFLFGPSQKELAQKHFPECANNDLAISNVSLTLLNSHESSNEPVPLVPNMINIGGFHINPAKELPKDLKEYLDNATNGVIYFSMGSQLRSSLIKPEIKEIILKAFGKLKQKVLWKYDQDLLPGKPENVRLGKWFPQSDILAHPNTKLFITHGGLLSTLETVHYGVPVLSLPVFADQKMNAAKAEVSGYGRKLFFSQITEQTFTEALNEMLNNKKYGENAKLRSILSHDRPMKPMDLAVYWTEFVARHRGAAHLKVAALNLAWYQYLLLDVIAIITFIISIIAVLLFVSCKKLCCSTKYKTKKD